MSVKTIKLSTFSEIWHRGSEQTGPSGSNKRKEEYETPENVEKQYKSRVLFFYTFNKTKGSLVCEKKKSILMNCLINYLSPFLPVIVTFWLFPCSLVYWTELFDRKKKKKMLKLKYEKWKQRHKTKKVWISVSRVQNDLE